MNKPEKIPRERLERLKARYGHLNTPVHPFLRRKSTFSIPILPRAPRLDVECLHAIWPSQSRTVFAVNSTPLPDPTGSGVPC